MAAKLPTNPRPDLSKDNYKEPRFTIWAFCEESYQYLETEYPTFLDAIKRDISEGCTPKDIETGTKRAGKSERMVIRAYQAACFIYGQDGGEE